MRYIILSIALFLSGCFSLCAQERTVTRVAVRNPIQGEMSEPISGIELSVVRSRFRDALSTIQGIELIDRTDVNNILAEMKFEQNGLVKEEDKKLLGQLKGVDIIVSLVVAKGYGYVNIESSFLKVETGNVVGTTQSVLARANDPVDLADKCVELAGKLTGITAFSSSTSSSSSPSFLGGGTGADRTFKVDDVTFKMVFVKGGTFQMGSYSGDDDERPVHSVAVSDFYMGEFEVTQALWQEVMGTTVYQQRDKAGTSWPMRGVGANHPIYYVNYSESEEFCGRLNQRLRGQLPDGYIFALPTEAEWEYAARGGSKSNAYTYSGGNYLSDVGWYGDNSNESTHAVGTKRANELGLYDMSGNVCEWCADWYGTYGGSSQTNPRGPSSGSFRVLRGGSWSGSASSCRVANRYYGSPGNRNSYDGFRLALVRR